MQLKEIVMLKTGRKAYNGNIHSLNVMVVA
jgi:hypothetical protein